ncbi:MAG: FAD-dependent oxidoreductase [Alphaproteobacteria bacterium]
MTLNIPDLKIFTFETDTDAIATLTWDTPGKSTNLIDEASLDELEAVIAHLEDDSDIKGVIVTSAKPGFCGGADITMLGRLSQMVEAAQGDKAAIAKLHEGVSRLSRLVRRLEICGKPLVAALPGTAVGGGYEIALGCHYRIAAKSADARFGLPEGRIGLFPGAGGTQRLARMIGPGDALQLMMAGRTLKAAPALSAKLIDKIVDPDELPGAARAWLADNPASAQPWDKQGFRIPGGLPYSKNGMMTFAAANAIYRRETCDNYPGLHNLMRAVYEGLLVNIDAGLRIEARLFTNTLMTREARAMMRTIFFSMRALERGARRPKGIDKTNFKKIGILGAGMMGAGIAYASASAGINVVLLERDMEAAEKGKSHSADLISNQIARGRAKVAERDALLARITATTDYDDLKGCDLVIEAVFENREIKAEVTSQAEARLADTVTFGSNTSTMPITSLAKASKRPENFIGIHFFSPVHKMLLVEIIMAEKTGDRALATALDFVTAIGKTPIVVNDARGFFTSRVVATYINEGLAMLAQGVPAAMVENLGRMAGMPVGPLALNDEVALDLALKISEQTAADMGDDYVPAPGAALLAAMVKDHGRLGRKNARGFYDYPKGDKKHLWPDLGTLLPAPRPAEDFDAENLMERFLTIQALETARCFEEGVLTDVRDGDVGAILGFGFAPFSGGPLSYIDMIGAKAFVARCQGFAAEHGARFAPNKLLKEMASRGETFYGRFAPE